MTRAVNLASAGSIVTESVGTAPGYMARAWVNFTGTGTVAINASGNVSSITDNGTGDYTVNFTVAMVDANYSFSVMSVVGSVGFIGNQWIADLGNILSTSLRITAGYRQSSAGAGTSVDSPEVGVTIFR